MSGERARESRFVVESELPSSLGATMEFEEASFITPGAVLRIRVSAVDGTAEHVECSRCGVEIFRERAKHLETMWWRTVCRDRATEVDHVTCGERAMEFESERVSRGVMVLRTRVSAFDETAS